MMTISVYGDEVTLVRELAGHTFIFRYLLSEQNVPATKAAYDEYNARWSAWVEGVHYLAFE